MNAKELTEIVEKQALMIELLAQRVEELETARIGMRAWAEKVQAHLVHRPAPKRETEWKSGPRPSHPVRRPQAPAAAAAELPPEEPISSGIEWKDLPVGVTEDCPF